MFDYLAKITKIEVDAPTIVQDFGETIQNLRAVQSTIQARLSELNQEIRAARTFLSVQTEFSREVHEQTARLKSIGLYKDGDELQNCCPVCESQFESPPLGVEQIMGSLRKVDSQLIAVYRASPHIQKHINQLSSQIDKLTNNLKDVQQELAHAISENENAQATQDQLIARARYVGKLVNILDTVQMDKDTDHATEQIAEVKVLIESVQQKTKFGGDGFPDGNLS